MENEINMNIEPKKNDKYPDHFNFATDLKYDHWLDTKPDNPTISLVVEKEGRPTKYEVSIKEVA